LVVCFWGLNGISGLPYKPRAIQPNIIAANQPVSPFEVSCWVPYWSKNSGIPDLITNISVFQSIRPFSFEVDSGGELIDGMVLEKPPFSDLSAPARQAHIKIIPAIKWSNTKAMHRVFANTALTKKHINSIIEQITKYNFDGVDIDYEGKLATDKENFTAFLKLLEQVLHSNGKLLYCTVEARYYDSPKVHNAKSGMAVANDYPALNTICDKVTLMVYDQWFLTKFSGNWCDSTGTDIPANCDTFFLKKVIDYTLKYISPSKLVIGLPDYGWSFSKTKKGKVTCYKFRKSLTWNDFISLPANNDAAGRSVGNEAVKQDERTYAVINDATSFATLFDIVLRYRVAGVSVFKMDGQFDPGIYKTLKQLPVTIH
jgi:spore germination protein YaaH